jgi:hypothetical protein
MTYPATSALPDGYQVARFRHEVWSPMYVGVGRESIGPNVHNLQGVPMGALAFATKDEAREWCYLDALGAFSEPLRAEETDGPIRLEDLVRR